jgi:hypothetical protein
MKHDEPTESKLSRAEIETLCLLDAVGTTGAIAVQVAERLGLCITQADAVSDALGTLVSSALLVEVDGLYNMTGDGRTRLVAHK